MNRRFGMLYTHHDENFRKKINIINILLSFYQQ